MKKLITVALLLIFMLCNFIPVAIMPEFHVSANQPERQFSVSRSVPARPGMENVRVDIRVDGNRDTIGFAAVVMQINFEEEYLELTGVDDPERSRGLELHRFNLEDSKQGPGVYWIMLYNLTDPTDWTRDGVIARLYFDIKPGAPTTGAIPITLQFTASPDGRPANYRTASIVDATENHGSIMMTPLDGMNPVIEHFGTWTGGGTSSARVDATHSTFRRLLLDDIPVSASNYTVTAGSTIITLNQNYLNRFENGEYIFRAEHDVGYADLFLNVNVSNNPTPSPGPGQSPAPSPGQSPAPSPSPGQSPAPSPGQSPAPSPSPGQSGNTGGGGTAGTGGGTNTGAGTVGNTGPDGTPGAGQNPQTFGTVPQTGIREISGVAAVMWLSIICTISLSVCLILFFRSKRAGDENESGHGE